MTLFAYKAYDTEGSERKGTLSGDSPKHVRQQLREQGLTPVTVASLDDKQTQGTLSVFNSFFRRITLSDLAMMTRELSALVGAGLPVEEALVTLSQQIEKDSFKSIILGVHDKVLEGYSLAKALGEFPDVFPNIFIATVAAGEESGHLTEVLTHLADYLERQEEVRGKIKQGLLYPLIMSVVGMAVVTFLLIFIVPSLVEVFKDNNQVLPIMTVILIWISDFLSRFGLLLLLGMVGLWILFKILIRRPEYLKRYHLFLLRIPVIKKALVATNTERFARTLGILMDSGVPLLHALDITIQLVTLIPMKEKLLDAKERIAQGVSMHKALSESTFFPPLMLHFIANGEATGRLGDMLQRSAVHQERKMMRSIDNALILFEPMLILIMGAVVLFIVLAVLLPMFEITHMVG